jgi:hypothetical protein
MYQSRYSLGNVYKRQITIPLLKCPAVLELLSLIISHYLYMELGMMMFNFFINVSNASYLIIYCFNCIDASKVRSLNEQA